MITEVPEKLAQDLKGFCVDMEKLGIPCTITVYKDERVIRRFGKKPRKKEPVVQDYD